jgi:LL-diaminopimelate aminotransferase
MELSKRLVALSEYHFQKLDMIKKEFAAKNKEIFDLSIGDPDISVDESILKGLVDSFKYEEFNKYPPYAGIDELKKSIIKYYNEVYGVKLNMEEVLILIGSKEGIHNLVPVVCDIGDYAIVPTPAYPVYETSCHLWGVNTFQIELRKEDNYLLNLNSIKKEQIRKSKLLVLNYPNNPTGAVATEEFYRNIISFSERNGILVYNDGAYNEIIGVKEKPLSILQFDKNKISIEFGTLSKTYNMTGFRIGYAVGNAKIISGLLKIKSNVDSGQFIPIQYAAIEALKLSRGYVENLRKVYAERRCCTEEILRKKEINFFKGEGTFYIWCEAPGGLTGEEYCEKLLNNYGIVVTPGKAFKDSTNKFFRIALTKEKDLIAKALNMIEH